MIQYIIVSLFRYGKQTKERKIIFSDYDTKQPTTYNKFSSILKVQ